MEAAKKPWYSKTVWLGVITAIAPFVPGVSEWVAGHVELIGVIWGGLATVLRLVTKDKVQLSE